MPESKFCSIVIEIGTSELFMGLYLIRRWIVSKAKGDVLEIAAGTGRNFKYYKKNQVNSITAIDPCASMLNIAK